MMTTEGKVGLGLVAAAIGGVGIYLIVKYTTGVSQVQQTIVPVKISSHCDSSANGAQITIGWNAVTGAASYNVMHEGGNTLAQGIVGTQATIDNVYIGNLTVYIEALNSSGETIVTGSQKTLKVCAQPTDSCYSWVLQQAPSFANC